MRHLFHYLVITLLIIFWISRVAICICYTTNTDIGIEPLNVNMEIILLFAVLFFMVLIIKKKMFGAVACFIVMGLYFGDYLYQAMLGTNEAIKKDALSICLAVFGIAISFITILDNLMVKRERNGNVKDEKTDWFFLNKDYDREHDERADENQYKF